VVGYPAHLRKTLGVALLVGSLLLAINHLDEIWSGQATARIWLKCGLTYLVPFCVSNYGLLVGRYRPVSPPRGLG
jgi:hypothetical protein